MQWSGHICHRSECRRTGFRPRQSPGGRQGCLWHHRGAQGLPFPFPSPPSSLTQPHILTPQEAQAWSEALGPGRGSACSAGPAAVCLQLFECLKEEFWYQRAVSSHHRAFRALLKRPPPAAPQRVLGRGPGRGQPRCLSVRRGTAVAGRHLPPGCYFQGMKSPGCKCPSSAVVTQCWPC